MNGKIWLSAKEISELLEISLSSAYKIIRKLNSELADKGYLVIPGKIPKAFFDERWYGGVI